MNYFSNLILAPQKRKNDFAEKTALTIFFKLSPMIVLFMPIKTMYHFPSLSIWVSNGKAPKVEFLYFFNFSNSFTVITVFFKWLNPKWKMLLANSTAFVFVEIWKCQKLKARNLCKILDCGKRYLVDLNTRERKLQQNTKNCQTVSLVSYNFMWTVLCRQSQYESLVPPFIL